MKPPVTPEEFWKLASFISVLTEEIETLASTGAAVPASAQEVTKEIELRSLVVEAVKAYLHSEWVTTERKDAWNGVLLDYQDRIKSLKALAEKRWLSLQMLSTFSTESQLVH